MAAGAFAWGPSWCHAALLRPGAIPLFFTWTPHTDLVAPSLIWSFLMPELREMHPLPRTASFQPSTRGSPRRRQGRFATAATAPGLPPALLARAAAPLLLPPPSFG